MGLRKWFLLSFFLLLGCSPEEIDEEMPYDMIGNEKTVPAYFDEISTTVRASSELQYAIRKADHQIAFEEAWEMYGFQKEQPDIDFYGNAVFFIGFYESGSCPEEIATIQWGSGNESMDISMSEKDGACTSDASPRSFAIEIDQSAAKEIKRITVIRSGEETKIPIE